jgi:hypothetical protein
VRAAIIGAAALLLVSALLRPLPTVSRIADDLVKIGMLAWLGVLVVAFGAKN